MITAMSAVVAALIALGIGVWENAQMRRHNRLSVVPHLDYTAQVTTSDTLGEGEATIWLSNEGVGPARIEDFRFRVRTADGAVREFGSWGEAVPTFTAIGAEVRTRAEVRSGLMLGTGRRLELIRFVSRDPTPQGALLDLLDRLQIIVNYRSVYGEPFSATFNADAALESELLEEDARR